MPYNDFTPARYQSPNAEDHKPGPAMQALNPRQRAVIYYLLDTGKGSTPSDWSDAAAAAGYAADSKASLGVQAHRLRNNPAIRDALTEEAKHRYALDLPMALQTVRDIAMNPTHKDALKAALTIAEYNGLRPVAKQEVHVVHHADPMEKVRAAAAVLGLDPLDMIKGRMKDVTPKPAQIEYKPELDISDLY